MSFLARRIENWWQGRAQDYARSLYEALERNTPVWAGVGQFTWQASAGATPPLSRTNDPSTYPHHQLGDRGVPKFQKTGAQALANIRRWDGIGVFTIYNDTQGRVFSNDYKSYLSWVDSHGSPRGGGRGFIRRSIIEAGGYTL